MLLLLAAGSGLARGAQPVGYPAASGANADPAANAPWFISTVDQGMGIGSHVSVAIDDSGTTYVSYYDSTNKDLKMAKSVRSGGNCGPNNSWSCQTIDSGEDVGKYSSIAINPASGQAGIAYYDAANGELEYAYRSCAPLCWWVKITVDEPIIFPTDNKGQYSSLKYHSDGTPYIAYYFENTGGVDALMVASYVGSGGNCGYGTVAGEWQCDTIQTGEGVGQYASLALTGSGRRKIAYYDGGNGDLWYAQSGYNIGGNCGPPGGPWYCYQVSSASDVGQYASLDVDMDDSDRPHIAYYDATNGKLMYAVVKTGGNCGLGVWQCDEIVKTGSLPNTRPVSLAVNKAGFPIIAYIDNYWTGFGMRTFNWARPAAALGLQSGNCDLNNAWQCEGIDGPWTGAYSAIAVNPSGLATIAYNYAESIFDPSELRVAYQQFQVHLPLILKNQ